MSNKAKLVDMTADKLVAKFQAPASRPFFCKCAWKLSEDTIWSAYEYATRPGVSNPVKYFVAICKSKM